MDPKATQESGDWETDVRVYELATGNLQANFRFTGVIQDLDFSPDGSYLVMTGSPIETIRHGHVYIYEWKKIMSGFGDLPSPLENCVLYDSETLTLPLLVLSPMNRLSLRAIDLW